MRMIQILSLSKRDNSDNVNKMRKQREGVDWKKDTLFYMC